MTILEALQEVKNEMPWIKTFIYADLNEANATETDKLVESEYPVMIVFPINPVDTIPNSGLTKTTFELNAMFLNKSAQKTTDYKSSEIEIEVIAPMRLIARKYIHVLATHSIIDPETPGITTVNYQPVYSSMDANLFGVSVRAQVPVLENPALC